MALTDKSLFLYGFQVSATNQYINFKISGGGSELKATLRVGYYSLTSLGTEVVRALTAADPTNTYTFSVNRTVAGGLENRVTIATSGSFLSILFGTGTQASASAASLLGFNATDYTGATSYAGSSTAGTAVVTAYPGKNYLGPDFDQKIQGTLNISASGVKEAIVYQIMPFWQVEFQYETKTDVVNKWAPLLTWAIQQRALEFTPEISSPTVFYEGTLETSAADGKGLAYRMTEMLSQGLPNYYTTGLLRFRKTVT